LSGEATLLAQLPAPRKPIISKNHYTEKALIRVHAQRVGQYLFVPAIITIAIAIAIAFVSGCGGGSNSGPTPRSASHIGDDIADNRVGTSRPSPDVYGNGGE
jgi:hypothetical protein